MTTVVALHGFTRAPRHLASFSEACQRRGWDCVRPAVAPRLLPVLMNSRSHLDHVADRLIDSGRLAGPVESLPIHAVMSPPSPCNRDGQLTRFLEANRPESVEVIPGAGHGDIEALGAAIYRRACKDTSGPQEWRAVQSAVLETVGELFKAA